MEMIKISEANKIFSHREEASHKGDYGKLLLIAGSIGMTGASVLAARSAYVSGVGLVTCAVKERLFPILQISVPEAICIERKAGKMDYASYDAIVIGPGIGVQRESCTLVQEVLKSYCGPLVIDADGLNCIAKYDLYQDLLDTKAQVVITPHPGEAKTILGVNDVEDRYATAIAMAQTFRVTAILKGAGTLVASLTADGQCNVLKNSTGNPGMATAGSGDVLAGIIGATLARGFSPFDAACTGVYVHGAAGDLAAIEIGQTGMMASDIIRHIPQAIRNISNQK